MSDRHALAQIAATNCFNGTYYADAESNLKLAKEAADRLRNDPEYIGKVAVFSRKKGYMKDMPAYLCAVLAGVNRKIFRQVFRRVIDNGKMLGNVVQIARSGQAGKVFNISNHDGTFREAIQEWFDTRNPAQVFRTSVGMNPGMKDVLCLARPKPNSPEMAALFAYLRETAFNEETRCYEVKKRKIATDKKSPLVVAHRHPYSTLPQLVRQYEEYKKTKSGEVPEVDFRLLDSLGLETSEWKSVCRNAGWQMTRMNLNTFKRHGVFDDSEMVRIVADRLRDREAISEARVFPYQLLQAYKSASDVPHEVREAVQDATEIAVDNVPEFNGKGYVLLDVSGSMSSSVTGYRPGATSATRCVDVAALFASSIMRKNRSCEVIPFDTSVHAHKLNPRDTVLTNAEQLAKFGGGGTDCGEALAHINRQGKTGDWVAFVSDNESWVDGGGYYGNTTRLMSEWQNFKRRSKKARLVCIDLTPRDNAQTKEHEDILQVGGFNDQVFEVVKSFLEHGHEKDHWVSVIEAVDIFAERTT